MTAADTQASPVPAVEAGGITAADMLRWIEANPHPASWLATAKDIREIVARMPLSAPSAPGEPLPEEGLRAALEKISEGGPDVDAPVTLKTSTRAYKSGFDQGCAWAGRVARAALEGSR